MSNVSYGAGFQHLLIAIVIDYILFWLLEWVKKVVYALQIFYLSNKI